MSVVEDRIKAWNIDSGVLVSLLVSRIDNM
jgi:hypothetical protein